MIIGTIQLPQFEIFANIKCCQADTVAIQRFEIFKETDSLKIFDLVIVRDRHLCDAEFLRIELAIVVCVTSFFEKALKFCILEFQYKIRRIKSNSCARRKGAEGLEGEHHSQCQQSTDQARSFCESLFHGVLLSVVKFIFSGPHSGEASASAEKRVPFFQKAVIAR